MKFGNPLFLYGLFALAIPIIIHLFNFRRYKTVIFSDITFLKEVTEQSQSKNRLKHWLLLLCRLLFILFLVLAFAQPYIPGKNTANPNGSLVSIFVDNSFSMSAEGTLGNLLEIAKKTAVEISKTYNESDRFQLITNPFEGKHQRFYTRDEFIQLVEEIKEAPNQRNLSEIFLRQQNAFSTIDVQHVKNHYSYIISDFQKSIISEKINLNDSLLHVNFVPLKTNAVKNLFIDSVWFNQAVLKPQENNLLYVKIKNINNDAVESKPINLFINGKSFSLATFSVSENNETIVSIPVKIEQPGVVNAMLSIDDYPITYDDKFYFSFTVSNKLNVAVINGKEANKHIEDLFKNDAFFQLTDYDESQLKLSELNHNNFIVLNELQNITAGLIQEVKKSIEEGSCVAVFPSANYGTNEYNLLSQLNIPLLSKPDTGNFILEKPDLKNPFFNTVFDEKKINKNEKMDLPKISLRYSLASVGSLKAQRILSFLNGDPFLIMQNESKGKIYFCFSPLDIKYNTLSRHALFVPIMYRMALSGLPENALYYVLGTTKKRNIKLTSNTEEPLKLTNTESKQIIIPPQKNTNQKVEITIAQENISEPGNYTINTENNTIIDGLSLNYNRNESVLDFLSDKEIEKIAADHSFKASVINQGVTDYSHLLKQESIGKKYWKICILLTLLALITEALLIRFYK